MKNKNLLHLLLLIVIAFFASCASQYTIYQRGVAYQSIRSTSSIDNEQSVPTNAKIVFRYGLQENGDVVTSISNLTDSVLTIDKTKSFFINTDGHSTPYYDPTVHISTISNTEGSGVGVGVNLDGVARAVGVGGVVGAALSAINVGGSSSSSTTHTNTTYDVDQPVINFAPHGTMWLKRVFNIPVGKEVLSEIMTQSNVDINKSYSSTDSYTTSEVILAYSFDEGKTYKNIAIKFYANSLIVSRVHSYGRMNDALRKLYQVKTDALDEPWYCFYFGAQQGNSSESWKNMNMADSYIIMHTFVEYK